MQMRRVVSPAAALRHCRASGSRSPSPRASGRPRPQPGRPGEPVADLSRPTEGQQMCAPQWSPRGALARHSQTVCIVIRQVTSAGDLARRRAPASCRAVPRIAVPPVASAMGDVAGPQIQTIRVARPEHRAGRQRRWRRPGVTFVRVVSGRASSRHSHRCGGHPRTHRRFQDLAGFECRSCSVTLIRAVPASPLTIRRSDHRRCGLPRR